METTLTAKQIKDLGLWNKVCEYKGWEYLSYDRVDEDKLITFDSEFKKKEIYEDITVINEIEYIKSSLKDVYNECLIEDNQKIISSVLDLLEDIQEKEEKK